MSKVKKIISIIKLIDDFFNESFEHEFEWNIELNGFQCLNEKSKYIAQGQAGGMGGHGEHGIIF